MDISRADGSMQAQHSTHTQNADSFEFSVSHGSNLCPLFCVTLFEMKLAFPIPLIVHEISRRIAHAGHGHVAQSAVGRDIWGRVQVIGCFEYIWFFESHALRIVAVCTGTQGNSKKETPGEPYLYFTKIMVLISMY